MGTMQECYVLFYTYPENRTLQNSNCTDTYLLFHKSFILDKQDMWDTTGEVRKNS